VLQHQGTSTNDYQFVGGYGVRKLNDTLGVMGVRQYSEKVGRFTTQDPMGFKATGFNFYRYALNDPLNYVDSTGLKEFSLFLGFGISVPFAGVRTAMITDPVCGDATMYNLWMFGPDAGLDVGFQSFEGPRSLYGLGGNGQRSWSFEGTGNISSFSFQVGIGYTFFTKIQIPNAATIVEPGSSSSNGAIEVGGGTRMFQMEISSIIKG
jgi:RHS repeat-associated protein